MTTPALAPFAQPVAPRSGLHTALLWITRLVMPPQAIAFALQPISIGSFLQGTWAALDVHLAIGGILVIVTWMTGVCGIALGVVGRHWWLVAASIALGFLTTAQVALGSTRMLVLHVPLGVALVALALWLAIWPWTRGAKGGQR
ncbi:hypothetical protein [Janibacter anophelis]|uniref:hypothetical protein n=1 Tax=Janibacter anophelis TaxID=319054 RepID=UPI000DF0180A|nr:hypothetical protein [Janibacter anophelis]